MKDIITLAHGSGGSEMEQLIKSFNLTSRGKWKNCDNDSSTYDLGDGRKLAFTSDSFIVTPIFFPGGDIGHLAFSGTVNDLLVMGAKPLGLSCSLVLEEGFPQSDLMKIMESIKALSDKYEIPIVTGDTKVMEKGKIDKIIINTSGTGIIEPDDELTKTIKPGDKVIISGGLGEHAVALLSKRFEYTTNIITDSKPLVDEFNKIRHIIKIAKDPTRGGLAAILNEIAEKNQCSIILDEESIPAKEEVKKVVEMLGINIYQLACEGRFVCIASEDNAPHVISEIPGAKVIGEIIEGDKVIIQTILGKRFMPPPSGRIVPRIC